MCVQCLTHCLAHSKDSKVLAIFIINHKGGNDFSDIMQPYECTQSCSFFHVDKSTRQSELCPHIRCGVEWGEAVVNARLLGSGVD